jgi:hypothetical protein
MFGNKAVDQDFYTRVSPALSELVDHMTNPPGRAQRAMPHFNRLLDLMWQNDYEGLVTQMEQVLPLFHPDDFEGKELWDKTMKAINSAIQ